LAASGIALLSLFVTFSTSFAFVPIYGADIGATDAELGYIMTGMFALSILGSLVYVRLGEGLGYRHSIALSSLLVAGTVAVTPLIRSVAMLVAIQALDGIGRGLQSAALAALAIRAVAPWERSTAMGVYQSVYAIGMLTGPLVSGLVAARLGISSVFLLSAAVSLVAAAMAYARVIPAR
jgi:MFS family permease